jgi:hypothetical protein
LVCASKVYSGLGADIVYGIITLIDQRRAGRRETRKAARLSYSAPEEGSFGRMSSVASVAHLLTRTFFRYKVFCHSSWFWVLVRSSKSSSAFSCTNFSDVLTEISTRSGDQIVRYGTPSSFLTVSCAQTSIGSKLIP